MPELRTKRGALTSYAFACGYIERERGLTVSREHGVYFVKGFRNDKWIFEGFETLKAARKFAREAK